MYNFNTLAQLCYEGGIRHVVLSPGSRVAPLALSFTREKRWRVHNIAQEHRAGFVALGLSQQSGAPTLLLCTSGSAPLHYMPAVAEAFYRQVPLLIITADRPEEWIGQQDGQTIPQRNIYEPLIKYSYQCPDLLAAPYRSAQLWHMQRIFNEALTYSSTSPAGPVHINIPLRTPLYTLAKKAPTLRRTHFVLHTQTTLMPQSWHLLEDTLHKYKKVLLLAGQMMFDKNIQRPLQTFCETFHIPLLADILSNLHGISQSIRGADLFLRKDMKHLRPEVLISFGGAVFSKHVKTFLRTNPPRLHFHLSTAMQPPADTLQNLTHHIPIEPSQFFLEAQEKISVLKRRTFYTSWKQEEEKARTSVHQILKNVEFGQFRAVQMIVEALPRHSYLHVANSMPVRYVNYVGLSVAQEGVEVWANRGTCGIEGSLATAIGAARASQFTQHTLCIGDISCAYDLGALEDVPSNLKIVVFNDAGGGIFRLLEGASTQPECEAHFVMPHKHSFAALAEAYRILYMHASTTQQLKENLQQFFSPTLRKTAILEVQSSPQIDKKVFGQVIGKW